jgi:hypothetical protein
LNVDDEMTVDATEVEELSPEQERIRRLKEEQAARLVAADDLVERMTRKLAKAQAALDEAKQLLKDAKSARKELG